MTTGSLGHATSWIAAGAAVLVAGILGVPGQLPQAQAASDPTEIRVVAPPPEELASVLMTNQRCHIMPLQGVATPVRPDCDNPPALPPGVLTYGGGAVMRSAVVTTIFVNCPVSCGSDWGNPWGFLNDLSVSNFIHVSDQYMVPATKANTRYTLDNTYISFSGAQPHTLSDSQLQALVILAVQARFPSGGGGGDNHSYSIFLPPGQDLCFNNSTSCYCPDNNCNGGSFQFCAYHSSFNSTDAIGNPIHVIYQAQPYDNVGGCNITNGPNGSLINSTNNVWSHELFEVDH